MILLLEEKFIIVRLEILNQDEDNHNWNKNAIAGKIVNYWLIRKKELQAMQEKQ